MGLPSDLTSKHAKLDANISLMRGHLEAVRSASSDGLDPSALEKIQPWTEQIGEMLHGYLDDERDDILQQAGRVLGEGLEEISEINDHSDELLERFDHFASALDEMGAGLDSHQIDELRDHFEEFIACFERHRDAERNFYSLYSTILFPSGAATD
ncbi:MAG: hypothetical protein ACOCV2_05375 [Persicimonas sp.]